VHHRVVDAELAAFVQRAVLVIPDGVGEAHAERQVARGIFIEQRVVEEQAGFADGRVVGDERALAEIAAALVHGDDLGQKRLVFLRVPFLSPALMEADPEAVDQLALVGQGLGRIDDALGLTAHRGNEALLRGNVRVEIDVLQAHLAAAAELRFGNHADCEIGAVGARVVQGADREPVQVAAALGQILVVLLPGRDGVIRHAARRKNGLPQLFLGLRRAQLREELLGPGPARHGRDAPLIFVLDLIAVFFHDGIPLLLGLGHLLLIDAAQTVGILGEQIDAAGDDIDIMLPACLFVVGELGHGGKTLAADVDFLQRLILPVHNDLFGAEPVTFLHNHFDELRLVQFRKNKDFLPLLDIDTALSDEPCVFSEHRFFHGDSPVSIKFCLLS